MKENKSKYSTIREMLQSLYPNINVGAEVDRDKQYEDFYQQDNLLLLLEDISKNMEDIYNNSDEEEKDFNYFVLVSRMKELYCKCEEYEKAIAIEEATVTRYLTEIAESHSDIDNTNIPLIINESIARMKIDNKLDGHIYSILKHMICNSTELIRIEYPFYSIYDQSEKGYCIEYNPEHLIELLILLVNTIKENEEFIIFEKVALNTLMGIYELYTSVMNESDAVELYATAVKKMDMIISINDNISTNIGNAYDFYKSAIQSAVKYYLTSQKLLETDIDSLARNFFNFFNGFKADFYNNNKAEVSKLMDDLVNLRYFCSDDKLLIKELLNLLKKSSTTVYKRNLIEKHVLKAEYIKSLYELKEYRYINQIYRELKDKSMATRFSFEIAYSLYECREYGEARNIYESMISNETAHSGVYNNLALIYEKVNRDYNKAYEYYSKGLELNSNDEIIKKNIERVTQLLKEQADKPKKLKDLYFKQTKPWHKKVLFAIYKLSENTSFTLSDLSEATKQSIETLRKNLSFLENMDMVEVTRSTIKLDPTIEQLIQEYIDPKLERQIVKVDNSKYYRPIFYHESEINLYRVLLELFPQHLVFPNISLKTIIDTDKMMDVLDTEIFKYLYMAHVDFVIINTSSYFPVLAFEKDSDYNDTDYAKENVNKKNLIFRTCGIPLIRLRFNNAMEYEKLKHEVREATRHMILEHTSDGELFAVDLTKEFDIRRFGIVSSPVSLELVKRDWEGIVGKAIAQKSRIIDIEEEKLIIEISNELKPIIDMSFELIKNKIIDKYDVVKDIKINWY